MMLLEFASLIKSFKWNWFKNRDKINYTFQNHRNVYLSRFTLDLYIHSGDKKKRKKNKHN